MSGPPRIVVGVDGCAASKEALRWAVHLAGLEPGAVIEPLLVWDRRSHRVGTGSSAPRDLWTPGVEARANPDAAIADVFGVSGPADPPARP